MAKTITKQDLINSLKDYLANSRVVDKNLADRVKYALDMVKKDLKKVAKADLESLVAEVTESLALPEKKPVEASTKPKKLGSSKKSEDESIQQTLEDADDDSENEDNEEKAEKAPAKSTKSKDKSKAKTDSAPAKDKPTISPLAPYFPAEIDHPSLGKLVAVPDKFHKYESFVKALDSDKAVYIAAYWNKRAIKECGYGVMCDVPAPREFPFDLDILQAVITCEKIDRVFAQSLYTEAMFVFNGDDFTPITDTDKKSGAKYNLRMSAGLEFEIYVPADEVESK